METLQLTGRDREDLARRGIAREELERQLELLRTPPPPVELVRACTLGDGIRTLDDFEREALETGWRKCATEGRLAKFVPASGAATRMFRDLREAMQGPSTVHGRAAHGGADSDPWEAVERLIANLPRFAFQPDLTEALARQGVTLDGVLARGETKILLETLLGPSGLDYHRLPKALIPFHRYGEGSRTAFTEHLVEGCGYLGIEGRSCRLHFTVSADQRVKFLEAFDRVQPELERDLACALALELSIQSAATDTLAIEGDGNPFRLDDGSILFRPSGHGALLANLAGLDGDIVVIKNIDNIAPARRHELSSSWKRSLIGLLAALQGEIFGLLEKLESGHADRTTLEAAINVVSRQLTLEPPEPHLRADPETLVRYLIDRLDRPLRVCGVVRNEGEPGGGPFWVDRGDEGVTGQIVESAQVDLSVSAQAEIWAGATHFNPVDLVCGLRDRHGRPYDLERFVDPGTSFVSEKSFGERSLKALERPGLWNGSMAGWNTLFVEVPLETFTPVKTVFDLLLPAHQP